jgi:hypothetical protein
MMSEADIESMLSGINEGDLMPMMQDVMNQLFAKDVMLPALTEINVKVLLRESVFHLIVDVRGRVELPLVNIVI